MGEEKWKGEFIPQNCKNIFMSISQKNKKKIKNKL